VRGFWKRGIGLKKSLRDKIDRWFLKDTRETFIERIELVLECEDMFEGYPDAIRYANTLKRVLEGVSVPLCPDDAFAGSVAERVPSEEEYAGIAARYKKWWDIPLEERHRKSPFYYSEGWLKCRPPWFVSYGHLALDWERIIRRGLGDFSNEAKNALETQTDPSKRDFLTGLSICYDAISAYISRYAAAAKSAGLESMADSLTRITSGPARTLYEALSLIWIVSLVCQKMCGCGVLNFGRMDQYLLPFYEDDLNAGRIDEDGALEMLEEFFFKNNEIMAQTDHMSQETEATRYTLEVTYDDPNYLIVAGKKRDGSESVNTLSRLMVRAAHNLRLRNPFMVVRYYDGIDESFFSEVCAAMRDNATIVLYNDETMIDALKLYGVDESDAYEYGFYGCNDPDIGANEGGLRQVWINLAKPLELALNRGDYPMEPKAGAAARDCEFSMEDRMIGLMTGAYYGIDTGGLDDVRSMDDFIAMYRRQMSYLIGEYRRGFERDFAAEKEFSGGRMRIEDCFLIGPLSNAVTWTLGGTKYHKIVTQGSGLATAADSLYAIERLVFSDRVMTLKELARITADDFADNEQLARTLRRKYGKFGNDEDAVDKYAKIVTDAFTDAVREHNGAEYLYQMFPTLSSDRDFTTMGLYVGATPDGRRRMEPLSENQSPSEGADISGLTATLNSVARIPFRKITGGPLNLRIHPGAVKGDDGLNALRALFKTYMQKGGMQLQINVVDADTLREAQKNPSAYRNLCVRVTGYSAFFVEMGKRAQEELIARTEKAV
jgi:formate C-acetyltransferase